LSAAVHTYIFAQNHLLQNALLKRASASERKLQKPQKESMVCSKKKKKKKKTISVKSSQKTAIIYFLDFFTVLVSTVVAVAVYHTIRRHNAISFVLTVYLHDSRAAVGQHRSFSHRECSGLFAVVVTVTVAVDMSRFTAPNDTVPNGVQRRTRTRTFES
jgi:hypothetical protein